MATGGVLGNGIKVAYSATSPVSWTRINQVTDVTFPTYQRDMIEITTHDPTNSFKRFMPGLTAIGDPTVTVLSDFDPSTSADQDALRAANLTGSSMWFRIEVPTDRARTKFRGVTFSAAVRNFEPATPINDKQTTKFTLVFDGSTGIQWDAAAGATSIT